MSWGTCYKGLNNIHFNYPGLMNDGRNNGSYEVGVSLDNKLKKEANIENNSDYRRYLQINADNIIRNNQLSACDECGMCEYNSKKNENLKITKPYIFDSIISRVEPYGYENSDLKNIYLSRQMLESKMYGPRIVIENS